jgi:hypothetical protein
MRIECLSIVAVGLLATACASPATGPAATGPANAGPATETVHLTFTTPADLEGWIATDGRWRVEDGYLVGTAPTGKGYPYLTFATHFATIDEVRIVGGLAPGSGRNFRVGVGPANAIFNWEMQLTSMFRTGFVGKSRADVLLQPGEDHEILFRQEGAQWRLIVDDQIAHEDTGLLHGTVTVFPMFGSTIRVKEITIRGRPLPWIRVHGPSSPPP